MVVNTNSLGALSARYVVIPLKPRVTPVNVLVVNPEYVNISSLILNRPYFSGNPFVLVTLTVSIAAVVPIPTVKSVTPTITSGVRLSNFNYWSKLSTRSVGPPLCSCEI